VLSFCGRSKVIQRARPRCCALIYRMFLCGDLLARSLVSHGMASGWAPRSVGDTRAAAAEDLVGVDLVAGDTGQGSATRSFVPL